MSDMRHEDFSKPNQGPISHSIAELERMREEIDRQICEKRESERRQTASRIIQIADEAGFSLPDLMDILPLRNDIEVRYRHPENPNLVWCGKGRRPLWMNDALDKGFTLKQLRA